MGFCNATSVVFWQVLWRVRQAPPPWEEQHRAHVRARGAEDGGGPPSPSSVKGKRDMVMDFEEMVWFLLLLHAGPSDALKGTSPGLGGGADPFFLCRIVLPKR